MVVGAYAATLLGIGFYFSRRQKTTEEYFMANRSMKPFIAGISLFASLVSTISFVATPGEMVQNGPVFVAVYVAALPFTFLMASWLLIPAIMRLRVTSAYELLEARLGRPVRVLASLTFILTRLVWMALMLSTMSTVLISIMGWDPGWRVPIAIIAGLLVTTYTLTGGIQALMVTDVLQFFLMLTGAILTVVWISVKLGGVAPWWPDQWVSHWAPQPFFSTDPTVRVTVVGTFVGTVIWWICAAGSDQLTIQRYLTTRDIPAARRAYLLNNMADIAVSTVLGLVGLALLGYYTLRPADLPPELTFTKNGDALFPHFISHYLPLGLSGLIVAAVIGASLSALSSGLNSIITVVSKDLIETLRPNRRRTERTKIINARFLAFAVGLVAVGGSAIIGRVPGNLIEVANKTVNLFGCPMFGLFFLAMFVPFATPFGAIFGAICSFSTAVLVAYWDRFTGQPGLSFQLIAPAALGVSILAGCGLSLLPTRGKPWPVIAAYSAAIIASLTAVFFHVRA
jgi:SSS family solute:Na+ symporter